jgi:hypothetical protein
MWSASCPGQFILLLRINTLVPMEKEVGKTKSQPGHFGEEENLLPPPRFKRSLVQFIA